MIEVRKLTVEDAEQYREIRLQSLRDHPEAFAASFDEERKATVADMREKLKKRNRPNNFIAGAFAGDDLVGVVGFYQYTQKKMRHKGYIWGMYVGRDYQGRGVGTKLLNYVKKQARELSGLEQVILTVASRNTRAKRLYEKVGFETYGLEKKALKVNQRYYDEEHMMMFI